MLRTAGVAALALGVLLGAGCSPKAPAPTVHESMTQIMAPQTQTVWDITSHAFNEKGDGLEASKITPSDWAQLGAAGGQLKARALALANAQRVKAVPPGQTIMGEEAAGAPSPIGHEWDAASAGKVQAMIDANPALFSLRARVLAKAGDSLVKASQSRDVRTLYEVSSNMDEVCDGCHQKFWGTDEPPPFPK